MLTEKKNIDQLFHDKLESYEKAPPLYVWKNIQGNLDHRKKVRRFTLLRSAGIAAAIVLAFLAGWMMTRTSHFPIREQIIAEKNNPNPHKTIDSQEDNLQRPLEEDITQKASTPTTALTTLGTFAPSIKSLNQETINDVKSQEKEIVLFETEEDFLNQFKPESEVLDQLGNWIKSFNSDNNTKENTTDEEATRKKETDRETQPILHIEQNQTASAQKVKPFDKKGKWSLKAEVSPLFTGEDNRNNSLIGLSRTDSKSENTFSAGMVAAYQINERLSVKSGIIYSKIKQSTSNIPSMLLTANNFYSGSSNPAMQDMLAGSAFLSKVTPINLDQLNAMNPPKPFSTSDIKQTIGYVEIPVTATYKIIDRKIDLGLSGGVSANVLVGNNASLNENGIRIASGETANLRDMVYSGTAGIELSYDINDKISVTVEPRVKRYINSISKNEAINFKPYQVGVYTGISYKFN